MVIGFEPNGIHRCAFWECRSELEEWRAPDGTMRYLDPQTLLPHAAECFHVKKWDLLGRVILGFLGIITFTAFYTICTLIILKAAGLLYVPVGKVGLGVILCVCFISGCVTTYKLVREEGHVSESLVRSWMAEVEAREHAN